MLDFVLLFILLMPILPLFGMFVARRQKQRRGALIGMAIILPQVIIFYIIINAVANKPNQEIINGFLKTPLLFFFSSDWTLAIYCLFFIILIYIANRLTRRRIKGSKKTFPFIYR